jgi:hypoxanthine phosphoribosyltransferase
MSGTDMLISADEIAARVDELAREIAQSPVEAAPLLLVSILRGAFVFTADVMRALTRYGVDAEVEFLGLSSYGAARETQGRVQVTLDLGTDVKGRDVLVIDDILDSGRTLSFVKHLFAARDAARVRACVLLDKPARREVDVNAEFVGFQVPDVFVVGYGMDVAGLGRGMPYIGTAPAAQREGK